MADSMMRMCKNENLFERYQFKIQICMQYLLDFTCNCRSNHGGVHQVPITARWLETMWIQSLPWLLHMIGAVGTKPHCAFR